MGRLRAGTTVAACIAGTAVHAGTAVLAASKGSFAGARRAPCQTVIEPERLARRKLVDRDDMAAVYAAKPRCYKAVKRVFDIMLSVVALVGLSPVFLAAALAILADDGRPVFYASIRPGKDMHPFPMYKFRSMSKGADARLEELLVGNKQSGAAFKIMNDPRVTRVGRFMREYSIDELPQLVNVLKGDMSIVGPRAIVPAHEFDEHERQRQVVRPGLTCYWQTMGRTAIPWEEWVELDLDYIQDMSLFTDARLIVRTLPAVFGGGGE